MSVDYRAIYGYGFLVSADDVAKIPDEKIDDFMDNPFCLCVDNYVNSNFEYFFGLKLCSAEPGYAFALPAVDNYSHNDFIQMIREFKEYFPDKDAFTIKHYLINQIS